MSISRRCTKCQKQYTLSVKACKQCGEKLVKFIVRLRCQDKKWITKTVESLTLARQLEAKLKIEIIVCFR
jgi:hypothetical protein